MRSNQLSYPAFLAIAGAKVSCFFELRNTFADFLQKIIFIGLCYKINAEMQKRKDLLFFDLRSTILLYQIANCKQIKLCVFAPLRSINIKREKNRRIVMQCTKNYFNLRPIKINNRKPEYP